MSLGLHFCHNELESVAINELSACCGMESHNSCDDEEEDLITSMACCDDLVIEYDIDSSFKVMDDKIHVKAPLAEDITFTELFEEDTTPIHIETSSIVKRGPPPYIAYCSLIFYA
jgi:hypothetical protein